jgi:hypothetical protein
MTAFVGSAVFVASSFTASAEGYMVAQKRWDVTERFRESWAIGHAALRHDLGRIARNCLTKNWDGYDALPLKASSIDIANRLLDVTPQTRKDVVLSIGAEPDGQVTFEWHKSASWTLSVSVSPTGELHYAALLGSRTAYGTEYFDPTVGLPEALSNLIRRVESA